MISCCEAEVMLLDRRYVPRISSMSVRQEVRTKDLVLAKTLHQHVICNTLFSLWSHFHAKIV